MEKAFEQAEQILPHFEAVYYELGPGEAASVEGADVGRVGLPIFSEGEDFEESGSEAEVDAG